MAKEYRVEIKMDGGPFEFDNSKPTVLKRSELEEIIKQYGGRKKKAEKKADKKAVEKTDKKVEKKAEADKK